MANEENIVTDERNIPIPNIYDYTQIEVLINGNRVSEPSYNLRSVSVVKEANQIQYARIQYLDGDTSQEKFAVSEAADFIPGNKIELQVGRDGKTVSVFKGIIVKHGIKATENGNGCLYLDCRDEAVSLTLGRKNKYFRDITDSDALKQVLGSKAGTLESTSVQHKELVQFYCTDWDFALSRAEMNSCILLVQDGKANMVKPSLKAPSIVLVYVATIEELDAEVDAYTQWQEASGST